MAAASRADALESLYASHHATIVRYLHRLTRDRDRAEELAQETFLRAGRGLDAFRGDAKASTWIYRIATNVYLDECRKTRPRGIAGDACESAPGEGSGPPVRSVAKLADRLFEESEMGRCVREVIDGLPPPHRAAIVLHDLQGLSNPEVARILECSIDAAKIRVHRARRRLRDALSERCEFYRDEENVLRCDRKPSRKSRFS